MIIITNKINKYCHILLFNKEKKYLIAASCLIIYDLIIRISYWLNLSFISRFTMYPDTFRDYLIERHILSDHYLTLVGPHNGVFNNLNSPLYHYFMSSILYFNNSLSFLILVNIFIQLLSIVAFYKITKLLFSSQVALIALLLISLSRVTLQQSFFMFQPFIMVPFFVFAFLFMILSYFNKRYSLLLISIIFISIAFVFHNSAFPLLPIFLIINSFIVIKNEWSKFKLILSLILPFLLIFLFLVPSIIFLINNATPNNQYFPHSILFSTDIYNFANNIYYNSSLFLNLNNMIYDNIPSIPTPSIIGNILFCLFLISLPLYFFNSKISLGKKIYLLIGIITIILMIILASFIHQTLSYRHFLLLLPISIIIIAEVLNRLLSTRKVLIAAKIFLLLLIIKIFVINVNDFIPFNALNNKNDFYSYADGGSENYAMMALKKSIIQIKEKNKYQNYNFFQLYYCKRPGTSYTEANFWLYLEDSLKNNFIRVDDKEYQIQYRQINKANYIFIILDTMTFSQKYPNECITEFLQDHKNYIFLGNIFHLNEQIIYLVRHN
jgi:hypothetical protein